MLSALRKQIGIDYAGDGKKELIPPSFAAILRGLNLGSDGAEANEKLWKVLQRFYDGDDMDLPIVLKHLCLQHGVQLVKTTVCKIMDMSSPMFCIAKQFNMCSVSVKLHDALFSFVDTHLEWIPASQNPGWKANPDDVQHAKDVLDMCYHQRTSRRRRGGHKESSESSVRMKEWYSAGQEMVAMSPGNWATRRIVHHCREGCCLSRAEAVDRIVTLACRVVLHSCICVPAENKWLSIYPVMLITHFVL